MDFEPGKTRFDIIDLSDSRGVVVTAKSADSTGLSISFSAVVNLNDNLPAGRLKKHALFLAIQHLQQLHSDLDARFPDA